jgi:hypothetical protein
MRARKALTVGAAAVGSALGALALRKRASRRRERVELYFEDGSLVSLADGAPESERLLVHARELLTAARSS